jgi:photosystem II stability/assembly factor-like uncharacterized protein
MANGFAAADRLGTLRCMRSAIGLLFVLTVVPGVASAQWRALATGTDASLRGLSVVDARTVWASGTRGRVVRSVDGGSTWDVDTLPGADSLDLRAIHARSARVAHVAATAGRIYRTTDGGRTWMLTWQASDTSVFLDAIDFWDDRNGVALGDPIAGRFLVLLTRDGGDTWRVAPVQERPPTREGEAAFAASGSSLVVDSAGGVWIGSGGRAARLFYSPDRSRTWITFDSPFRQGSPSQGIFGLAAFEGRIYGVGGDYQHADSIAGNASVFSGDSTREWLPRASPPPRGYRSGVAAARARGGVVLLAVGPSGTDLSSDGGRSWTPFDPTGFHAVRASADGVFFASGSNGRIATFDSRSR